MADCAGGRPYSFQGVAVGRRWSTPRLAGCLSPVIGLLYCIWQAPGRGVAVWQLLWCVRSFSPGDEVWVYNPTRKKDVSPKLTSKWVGPCEVLEQLSDVVYRVRMSLRGQVVVLHQDRLAPY